MTQLCSHTLSCSPIQVGRRTIINKLFFDLAQEEESVLDAEFLKVPRIYLILLNSKPSEHSLSAPTQGNYLEYGDGVLEGRLGRDFKVEARRAENVMRHSCRRNTLLGKKGDT